MYLTAFIHREKLFEITNRWLSNRLNPDDPLKITKIITYDSFVAWESMLALNDTLLKQLYPKPFCRKRLNRKKDLKDYICNIQQLNKNKSHLNQLIADYRNMPEFYYVGSPIAGYVYHADPSEILAICRFKRVKRIAEKANRYISRHFFQNVQSIAYILSGIDPTSVDKRMRIPPDVFVEAEKKLMSHIKDSGIQLPVNELSIKDILGVKIIDNGIGEQKLENAIDAIPNIKIIEKESHSGNYNAIHYVVEQTVNFDDMIRKFCAVPRIKRLVNLGLPKDQIEDDFSKFMRTGADTIEIDMIFTTPEELIESEIGRSMHESRIFEQRRQQNYYGNIPINIEYIIEFLFAIGLSPVTEIEEIPIKIWGRYIPDTLSYTIRNLYGLPEYTLISLFE